MTPQQFVGLAIRMFAVVLVAMCIPYLTAIPALLRSQNMDSSVTFSVMIGIAYIIFAIAIWFFPMLIAHKLVPKTTFENRFNTRPDEVATVAVAILGLWQLIQVGPDLIAYIFRANLNTGSGSLFMALGTEGKAQLLILLITLVFALAFIFKANAIARFITKSIQD